MLDDYEAEARTRDVTLGALGKLHSRFIHHRLTDSEAAELRRLKAALELADDADTFVALYHGKPVPAAWYKRRISQIVRRR